MADGYARYTNQPQCVIIHVDVGTQGLGAAVHNASCGRAPVLVFAGLSPYTIEGEYRGSRTEYIHWIQDVPDQKQIVAQYCRYTGEIKRGKNVKVCCIFSFVVLCSLFVVYCSFALLVGLLLMVEG
jgi:thiamine pyrophosphate-dependent acetolactate synthase large subunit-like protein